jgi:formiminotetrahydrofolate cyclodeaminase
VKKFKNHTISEYLTVLSKKEPVPGGGSVAALTAASAVALLSMVAEYSKGRKNNTKAVETRITKIALQSKELRNQCLDYVDLDAQAYLQVVKVRKGTAQDKRKAERECQRVPKQVAKLAYKAVKLAPYLVEHGNPYLVSDVAVAVELLLASHNSAVVLAES